MTQFVDTNIFIRYLTRDDPQKAEACLRLFEQAKASGVILTTSESVLAEVVFVLGSPRGYRLSRADVRARLYPLVAMEGLKLADRRKYFRALDLYATHNIDFEDALTVAHMEQYNLDELYSYDRDFDRVGEVKRIEP
jgi:predicted nucleic acid-binding protein